MFCRSGSWRSWLCSSGFMPPVPARGRASISSPPTGGRRVKWRLEPVPTSNWPGLTTNPGPAELSGTGYVYPPFLAVLLSIPVRLGFNKLACWLLWTL